MPERLTSPQAAALLDELCVKLGFCLPPADRRRLEGEPPADVDAFTDAVFAAEGLDPHGRPDLRRQVVACVATHFSHADV